MLLGPGLTPRVDLSPARRMKVVAGTWSPRWLACRFH